MLALPSASSHVEGPRKMRETYAANRGDFHVHGYEGLTAKDHIDHIWAMDETEFSYLRARWER